MNDPPIRIAMNKTKRDKIKLFRIYKCESYRTSEYKPEKSIATET